MDSSAPEQVTEKSLSETAVEVRDLAEKENTKPAQIANSKIGVDAERIRSSISRLTSNSIDELEKLISKLQELQEFLTSETSRVQGEIGSVLNGVGIIIEAIAPWKTDGAVNTRTNGRDKFKRWP
jgi:putative heme degradation protein